MGGRGGVAQSNDSESFEVRPSASKRIRPKGKEVNVGKRLRPRSTRQWDDAGSGLGVAMAMKVIALGVAAVGIAACLPVTAAAQGGLDPTFGEGGVAELRETGGTSVSHVEVFQGGPHRGKIVVAGEGGASSHSGYIARVDESGKLDGSFGDGGTVRLPRFPSALALYDDGSIAYSVAHRATVGRLLPNGEPDAEFGVVQLYEPPSDRYSSWISLVIDPTTEDLLVPLLITRYAGLSFYEAISAEVFRFNTDGSEDSVWGDGSSVPIQYQGDQIPHVSDIEVGSDGSVWVVGAAQTYGDPDRAGVQRLTRTGEPHPDFTPGLPEGTILDLPGFRHYYLSLVPGNSDLPIVKGSDTLVRVGSDGAPVPGFPAAALPDSVTNGRGLSVDPLGRIILRNSGTVVRLTPEGALDGAFGRDGIAKIRVLAEWGLGDPLGVTSSTQILGGSVSSANGDIPALARLSDSVDPDLTPPETTIGSGPDEGATTQEPLPSFELEASRARVSFDCSVTTARWRTGFRPCVSPFVPPELPDGPVTISVRAVSVYGVEDETPATRSFTVEGTPLDTLITSGPAEGETVTDDFARFTFAATPREADHFRCAIDGEDTYCGGVKTFEGLRDGRHKLRVWAVDRSGREDPTPAVRNFVVRTPPPDCEFPKLSTPPTLGAAVRHGIAARFVCSKRSRAKVKLRVTKAAKEAFGLRSRKIGYGLEYVAESQREDVVAELKFRAARKLAKFRGATVHFEARIAGRASDNGKESEPLVRYGRFKVGR